MKRWKLTPTTAIIGGLGVIAYILYAGLREANDQLADAKKKLEAESTLKHILLGETPEEIEAKAAAKEMTK